MINFEDFAKVDIRAGTIVKARNFEKARKPAYQLWVNLGELGIRKSSAQITHHYTCDELVGKKVVCVVNFPPKQIADFMSEILVTGFPDQEGHIVLCVPDKDVPDGVKLF